MTQFNLTADAWTLIAGPGISGACWLDSATSDELQLVVQDDLTGLTSFKMAAWGHKVT